MKEVWVLTEEYDYYDHHSGYFLAVFKNEPSEKDLKQFGYSYFGRRNDDYRWANKSKVVLQFNG